MIELETKDNPNIWIHVFRIYFFSSDFNLAVQRFYSRSYLHVTWPMCCSFSVVLLSPYAGSHIVPMYFLKYRELQLTDLYHFTILC